MTIYKHTTPNVRTSQVDRGILDNCPLSAMHEAVGEAVLPNSFPKQI